MKSYSFLFWAYNVVWIVLAGYVGLLFYRIGRTNRRIDRLEQRLRDGDGGS